MGRKIPMWQTILVMLAMVGFLMWSIIKDNGGEPHIALILAAGFAGIVAVANGWKWAYLEQGILASINRSMQAILILAILGAIIASWMAAGTIPSMMYYGIKIISPKVFLLTACILCCIVSLATGSSWSTAGSMGVALMGVGAALGFPQAMTAGAVVSGAYFGDKMSPLSDTTNLAPAMAGATLFGHIKHMVYTTGTSLGIALIAYAVMGFMHASNNEPDMTVMMEILHYIEGASNISLITLIPPLFVIVAVAMKLPAIPSLVGGALLGVPLMFYNHVAIETVLEDKVINNTFSILNNGITLGVVPEDASPVIIKLADLLSSSGMQGMMWTISIILAAMCFGGIVDVTGMMASVAAIFLKADVHSDKRNLLRPVLILSTSRQNVQGIFRRYETTSGEPFQMPGRCRNDYFQLLLVEHLWRYDEKVPRRRFQLHSVRNSELAESDCIRILRFCRNHNDKAYG